jgi:hypothetical protein
LLQGSCCCAPGIPPCHWLLPAVGGASEHAACKVAGTDGYTARVDVEAGAVGIIARRLWQRLLLLLLLL